MSDRYLIISGTNRSGSNTFKVALQYRQMMAAMNIDAPVVSLEDIIVDKKNPAFTAMEEEHFLPVDKFVFIAPEYNGSIPGVLKCMLDISDYKKVWWGKKALLVGISTGRSGNVRGLEHLTSILNYLKVIVHPNKLPISLVDQLINGSGIIHDEQTVKAMNTQIADFTRF